MIIFVKFNGLDLKAYPALSDPQDVINNIPILHRSPVTNLRSGKAAVRRFAGLGTATHDKHVTCSTTGASAAPVVLHFSFVRLLSVSRIQFCFCI